MPKQLILFIIVCFTVLQTTAQRVNTDMLWKQLEQASTDSIILKNAFAVMDYYRAMNTDSNAAAAKRVLILGEQKKCKPLEAYGYMQVGYAFRRMGDIKKDQDYLYKAARINEQYYNRSIESRILNGKAGIEDDTLKKMAYYRKALLLVDEDMLRVGDYGLLTNIAYAFRQMRKFDSALHYLQIGNELAIKFKDTSTFLLSQEQGRLYLDMQQYDLAHTYLKRALKMAEVSGKDGFLQNAYRSLQVYFDAIKQPDSALLYATKIISNIRGDMFAKQAAVQWLYKYYQEQNDKDKANLYMLNYISLSDSINKGKKTSEVQRAKFEEDLRIHDAEVSKEKEKESRNHNLQLAVTAIAILVFLILFLLLSRSILVSHKVVAFLNVIVLLVVFEFINLLMHPFLERVTHHSPVLMLLALVAIAALIVPLHHKLEHWTTKKLVEKNKAIRLAKAKKTIEELEEKNTDNNNPTTTS